MSTATLTPANIAFRRDVSYLIDELKNRDWDHEAIATCLASATNHIPEAATFKSSVYLDLRKRWLDVVLDHRLNHAFTWFMIEYASGLFETSLKALESAAMRGDGEWMDLSLDALYVLSCEIGTDVPWFVAPTLEQEQRFRAHDALLREHPCYIELAHRFAAQRLLGKTTGYILS